MDKASLYLKNYLQKVYTCQVDYTLIAKRRTTKMVAGHYKPWKMEIVIYNIGRYPLEVSKFIAIRELAHHIHFTEFNKTFRNERTHGAEFWAINDMLLKHAREKGILSATNYLLT